MDQYQLYAKALQQGDVVHDVVEILVRNGLARQQHDEHLLAVRVDVAGRVSEPVDVLRKIFHGGNIVYFCYRQ